jgi:glycosyltransferase involved in cell wall biosynthesis
MKQTISELGISDRVLMLGSRDDVAAIMQALDLLIVNSSSEACCLVILEAMACGTPVLAARTGGTPELIDHGKNGWLVPLGDQEMLANDIIRLLGESDLRLELGRQATQGVTANFGLDQYMRRVQNFYSASEVVDFCSISRHQAAGAITSQSN